MPKPADRSGAGARRRPPAASGAPIARPLVDAIETAIGSAVRHNPFHRSPQAVRAFLLLARAINAYVGGEVRGWDRLPRRGPFLIVGNHSGGAGSVDPLPFLVRWVAERGPEAPLYFLAYDLLFAVPVLGPSLQRVGIVPANPRTARQALDRGAAVMVFPGGDHEVFRPWTDRNRVDFGGRSGFVSLAIAAGVPVVPMTIHGAHESTLVLTRGERIAKWLGAGRINVNVFPIVWNIPFGPMPAFVPSIPLPAKVTVQLGAPLDWSRYGAARARDPRVVRRCYDEITSLMQRTLDVLAAEHPYPLLERLTAWATGGAGVVDRSRHS